MSVSLPSLFNCSSEFSLVVVGALSKSDLLNLSQSVCEVSSRNDSQVKQVEEQLRWYV